MTTTELARGTLGTVAAVLLAGPMTAAADPPDHAPAHGWRDKHERGRHDEGRHEGRRHYAGISGRDWDDDYEISSGRCNREAIATVVGGVVGGVIASRVADDNRAIATVLGIAAGALVGNKVGERLDAADRGCMGHALEIGEAGRPVVWENDATGVRYELSPGARRHRDGLDCREYVMVSVSGRRRTSQAGLACQIGGGWEIET